MRWGFWFQRAISAQLCVLFAVVIAGCVSAPTDKMPPFAAHEGSDVEYLIAPGDTLSVFVWNNPSLSVNTVPVRPDGRITTPLAENVKASGKTSTQLAREIEGKLARFVKAPHVAVTILKFEGRYKEQIRVIGEAAKPSSLRYREGMTVLDVVIAVGGLTEFADGNKAILVRNLGGTPNTFRLRLDDLINKGDISANVDMLPGDILIIPEVSWF